VKKSDKNIYIPLKRGGMDRGGSGVILFTYILVRFNLYAFIQNWDKKTKSSNGNRGLYQDDSSFINYSTQ
jgi:hypothetical protein